MFCWQCGERLSDTADRCSACGVSVAFVSDKKQTDSTAGREIHNLLSQANLLRLKKDWQTATLRCTEALHIFPKSAPAHSLLGDICRDQGRYRDAIEWYKLSLSLDPNRRADREKLDVLIDNVYGSPGKSFLEEGLPEALKTPNDTSPAWIRSSVRYGSFFFVALILVTLSAILLNYRYFTALLSTETAITRPPRQDRQEAASQGSESVLDATREENVLPSTSQRVNTERGSRGSSEGTVYEEELAKELSSKAAEFGKDTSLQWISVDKRTRHADIAFLTLPGFTVEDTRLRIIDIAFNLSRSAVLHESTLEVLTLRANLHIDAPGEPYTELVFIGDIATEDLRFDGLEQLFPEQAEGYFYDVWWHPDLFTPPA